MNQKRRQGFPLLLNEFPGKKIVQLAFAARKIHAPQSSHVVSISFLGIFRLEPSQQARDMQGRTALSWSSANGHVHIIEVRS